MIKKKKHDNLRVRANRILSTKRKGIDPDIVDKFYKVLDEYRIPHFPVPLGEVNRQFVEAIARNGKLKASHQRIIADVRLHEVVGKKRTTLYNTYIEGDLWTKRKNLYYQDHRRICKRCGSFKIIQLHHMVYDKKSFGNEPDSYLVPLCKSCHDKFHKLYPKKSNMVIDTNHFIDSYGKQDLFKSPGILVHIVL